MGGSIARTAVASGTDPRVVARALGDCLAAPDLRLVFLFADWRLDSAVLAAQTQRTVSAPVVGGTSIGLIGAGVADAVQPAAVAIGLYGEWLRVGIGVAAGLPNSALSRSRDAVIDAATALGTTADALDPRRHVGVTIVDGMCGQEEAFCIGSAAAVPQIRVVGGCASTELGSARKPLVWVRGEVLSDAGVVIVLDSELPFDTIRSAHVMPTQLKTVVTAASGRAIDELDGRPAVTRLRELLAELGDRLDEQRPSTTFARYVDGIPYVRSIARIQGQRIHLASAVDAGHVLVIMRPGDLIGTTRRDLEASAARVGGSVAALLAFSCIGRHWEASARGLEAELVATYAAYPTCGLQSFGEQSGMLLVNHTLTGLAIGAPP